MRKGTFLVAILASTTALCAFAQTAADAQAPTGAQSSTASQPTANAQSASNAQPAGGTPVWKYIGAALAVGFACVGGGLAVGQIGSAAMGAMAEKPELSGKALPYVGLAEGICLWGFLVALIMLLV